MVIMERCKIRSQWKRRLTQLWHYDIARFAITLALAAGLGACGSSKEYGSDEEEKTTESTTVSRTDTSTARSSVDTSRAPIERRGEVWDTTTGSVHERRSGVLDTNETHEGEHFDTTTGTSGMRRGGVDTSGSDIEPYRRADTSSASSGNRRSGTILGEGNQVTVRLSEYRIELPRRINPGMTTFSVTNTGKEKHGFTVSGNGITAALDEDLRPGETSTLRVNLPPGTYEVYCGTGNDRNKGMTVQITVSAD